MFWRAWESLSTSTWHFTSMWVISAGARHFIFVLLLMSGVPSLPTWLKLLRLQSSAPNWFIAIVYCMEHLQKHIQASADSEQSSKSCRRARKIHQYYSSTCGAPLAPDRSKNPFQTVYTGVYKAFIWHRVWPSQFRKELSDLLCYIFWLFLVWELSLLPGLLV